MEANFMDLVGNILYGQSGGPSPVINASAYGVIDEARKNNKIIKNIYCCHHGVEGILKDDLIDLSNTPREQLELLPHTPGAAFGSIRFKLSKPEEYQQILKVFKKHNIRYFFYNGGNDSMDTCNKISKFLQKEGYDCRVIGIPKTIDNDLPVTDHTPGYASVAKFIANMIAEAAYDALAYKKGRVIVFEIMGRNAGWLAAASKLACLTGFGPDLIYLPEKPFSMDKFRADVLKVYSRKHKCIVIASEGIKYADQHYVAERKALDSFGHKQMGGVASMLTENFTNMGIDTRAIEFSLLQRSATHLSSKVDVEEAIGVGRSAVIIALEGKTNYMVTINRLSSNPYKSSYNYCKLSEVANIEKVVPDYMINDEGNNVTQAYIDYALPLIEGENTSIYKNGLVQLAKIKL